MHSVLPEVANDHLGWPGRKLLLPMHLCRVGYTVLTDEGGEVTSSGGRFLAAFGADLGSRTPCGFSASLSLDWRELSLSPQGTFVGARIPDRLLCFGWLQCVSGSRALQLTSSGRAGCLKSSRSRSTTRACQPVDYAIHDGRQLKAVGRISRRRNPPRLRAIGWRITLR